MNRTADKRERILEAATRIFADKGFFNAKISDIARAAEVADGTIYLYFKNKDDILIQIFEQMADRHLANIRSRVSAGSDAVDKLRRFIQYHFETVERYPQLAEVITIETRQSSKFMKDYVPKRFFAYLDMVADLIVEGQKNGLIRKNLDPGILKTVIVGALEEGTVQWLKARKKRFSLKEFGDQITTVFLKGMGV